MTEAEVENAVVDYFRASNYKCLPDKTLGWRKFEIYGGKQWEPDVIAFRWGEDLTLDIRAVECKDQGTLGSIISAREQVLLYKKHFPWCYIATREPSDQVKSDLAHLRNHYHVGYIPVKGDAGRNFVVESEVVKYQIYRNYLNHDLDEMAAIMNRQKLATLDAFADQFGANKVFLGFEQDYMWMSTREPVQYHIDSFNSQNDFQFGLDIETQPDVKRNLKGNMLRLQRYLQDKPWHDFVITVSLRVYSNRRKMPTPVIQKSCKYFTNDDARDLETILEKRGYQVIFLLRSTIWKWDEVLFKREYDERLLEARRKIDTLRKDMSW